MKRVPVLVAMRGRRVPTLANRLARRARALLRALRLDDDELSLLLVSDAVIHGLNRTWRGKDRPTDVLSFAQAEGAPVPGSTLLGDLVLCLPVAARQAKERGHPTTHELDVLLVHGLLHLLGHDHERVPPRKRAAMFAEQARLVSLLAVPAKRSRKRP